MATDNESSSGDSERKNDYANYLSPFSRFWGKAVHTGRDIALAQSSSGPRDDFISILADRVVTVMNQQSDGPIIQESLEKYLPSDKDSVRTQLPFYNSALEALQYQRDSYLVCTKYADEKQRQRQRRFPYLGRFGRRADDIQYKPHEGAGYAQLVNLGAWFIPSETVKSAVLPVVTSLPSGVLSDTILSTVCNAIPLAQPSLDLAMK